MQNHKSKIYKYALEEKDAIYNYEVLYACADDDVKKGYIKADEFYKAIQMSPKYYSSFPTYPEVKDIISKIRSEHKDLNDSLIVERLQIEAPKTSPEQAKEYIANMREMLRKNPIG